MVTITNTWLRLGSDRGHLKNSSLSCLSLMSRWAVYPRLCCSVTTSLDFLLCSRHKYPTRECCHLNSDTDRCRRSLEDILSPSAEHHVCASTSLRCFPTGNFICKSTTLLALHHPALTPTINLSVNWAAAAAIQSYSVICVCVWVVVTYWGPFLA